MEGVFTVNVESCAASGGVGYNPDYLFARVIQSMRTILTLLLFAVLINTSASASEFGKRDKEAIQVSMYYLLANPEKFRGKLVRITGVLNLEFESNSIFVDRESFDYYNAPNGFWVEVDEKALGITDDAALALKGKMVVLEGIFQGRIPNVDACVERNKKSKSGLCITIGPGHSGGIEKVNYLSELTKMN